jgi:iron-sulfur cluster repair protein YtfE (RIC family)
MTTATWESFLRGHVRLRDGVERLRTVGDAVGKVDHAALRVEVDDIYGFLSHRLLPHIAVEARVLYPAIAGREGYGEAARILSRDHAEISELVRELAGLRDLLERARFGAGEATELRRVLYGLYELLGVHMANEEDVCLPMLDRALSDHQRQAVAEGIELFESAEQAAE